MQATETAVSSVTFPGSVLKALLKHTAKGTSRYAINGIEVIIQGNTAQLTATDGRRLARVRVNGYEPKPPFTGEPVSEQMAQPPSYRFLLSGADLKSLPSAAQSPVTIEAPTEQPKPGDPIGIQYQTKPKAPVVFTQAEVMEGSFPPYEEVIPKAGEMGGEGIGLMGINPSMLSEGCALCQTCCGTESRGVRLSIPSTAQRPLRIDGSNDDRTLHATVVIMPISLQ